jgi:DNA-binding NarL/FixJ family response regulator
MAEGPSNGSIADRLAITERTVESHVAAIFTKLDLTEERDLHRRVTAVVTWLRHAEG